MDRKTVKLFYSLLDLIKPEDQIDQFITTKITVVTGNMLEIASQYDKPLIHNFANNHCQGGPSSKFTVDGEWISTSEYARTQEDQIIRNYQNKISLPKMFYPICQDDEINGEAILYSRCLDLPAVATIPSLIQPNLEDEQEYDSMIHRILLLLYTAKFSEHTLITGLWGCGVFGMKPDELVELWKDALKMSKYQPKDIVFCIYLDRYTEKYGDLEYFQELFIQITN